MPLSLAVLVVVGTHKFVFTRTSAPSVAVLVWTTDTRCFQSNSARVLVVFVPGYGHTSGDATSARRVLANTACAPQAAVVRTRTTHQRTRNAQTVKRHFLHKARLHNLHWQRAVFPGDSVLPAAA